MFKKKYKVLVVYPNIPGMLVISIAIGILTRMLKDQGFDVDLYDATLYNYKKSVSPLKRVQFAQAREFSYEKDLKIDLKNSLLEDFVNKVDEYKPDLLAISLVEDALSQCLEMLDAVAGRGIPHIIGGIAPTTFPDKLISFPQVKNICVGEGEKTLIHFIEQLRGSNNFENVPNLWYKNYDGIIYKNNVTEPIDLDTIVKPDFSLFDERRLYRPMGGRIFKTIPLETYRGCPYQCSYCCSPMWDRLYKNNGYQKFNRRKSIDTVISEIRYYIKEYKPELFYFVDDTFLARSEEELTYFVNFYKKDNIPFWINTRPETLTKSKLELLTEINCFRMSIGLECGNETFRKEKLKRKMNNKMFLDRINNLVETGIAFSINNMIGFPDETREMIFETIEMNRKISGCDAITVSIFTPYHGSELRNYCIEKGYLSDDTFTGHTTEESMLNMPQLSKAEINGLMKTFNMYVKFPKKWWRYIELAEKNNEEGEVMYEKLINIYHNELFTRNQDEQLEKTIDWDYLEKSII